MQTGTCWEKIAAPFPIEPENVEVRYSGSGFGYADDDDATIYVQPLVTVSVSGMQFNPIALLEFAAGGISAEARATLTAEDSGGSFSN